ncbi:hypothetical protein ABGB18_45145 [Nonomuraea sp. B12E4]|uniref:hypothetical protein n=1 Tax=Nonomuraea sp. B12E4 TaxID=3153564 RepID=UPI00325F7608
MYRIVTAMLSGAVAVVLATGTALAATPAPSPSSTPPTSPTVTNSEPTTQPPTDEPTDEPTTPAPKAAISVSPRVVSTRGDWVKITVNLPGGTDATVVQSRAFGRHPLEGKTELTVRTHAGLPAGPYQVSLFGNGIDLDAQTWLRVGYPKPIGPAKTGDGATQADPVPYAAGLGLIAAGGLAATAAALRRRDDV